MAYLGSWKIDDTPYFYANTHRFDTGAATDADSAPSYRVYENNTATPLLTGTMNLLDGTNTAGFYEQTITLSAANGFEKGKSYSVYISATVNSVVGTMHHNFQIEAEVDANTVSPTVVAANVTQWLGSAAATPTVAGVPEVDITHIAGAAVSVSTAQLGVNVVNAAGTAWGSGAITAASIATDAIGAAELAADAVTEIANAVWDTDATARQTAGTFGKAIGDPLARTNSLMQSVPDAVAGAAGGLFIAGSNAATTVNITGNLTGNVSGSVGSVTGAVGSVTGAVGSVAAGGITAASIATGAIDADALAADAVDEIWDEVFEGTLTMRQGMRLFLSALAGKLAGAATTTVTIRDNADTKARITATVDADGNRTAVTLDAT